MHKLFLVLALAPVGLASAIDSTVRTDEHGLRAVAPAASVVKPTIAPEGGDASDWQALGPFGGDMEDVAVSPINSAIVLAGLAPAGSIGGTLYRSTNGGDSWTAVSDLNGVSVFSIAFTPTGVAYIGTPDGAWKSTSDGANWTQLNLGIGPNDQVTVVTIDPNDAQAIWIGIADALGGQPINVMRSANGGTTWTNRTPPLASPLGCRGIAINPNDSNTVAACFGGSFGGGQVWVSTNAGVSWINRSGGLPNRPLHDIVHDGARLLLVGGTAFGGQTLGAFTSNNLGVSWTPLHDGTWPNLTLNDVAVDSNDPQTIYIASGGSGVFRSTNGGADWSFGVGGTSSLTVNAVRFEPGSSTDLWIGGSSVGVLKSDDSGDTFEAASVGIGALNVESVAFNPLDPSELAIAFSGLNDGGVYTSLDGGRTWTLEPLPGTRFNFVAFAPNGQLYAISDGPTTIGAEGLYRRNPNGSWSGIGPNQGPLFESELMTIEFSRNNPSLILAAGSDFGVAGFEATIWRTGNGGVSWNKVYEGAIDNDNVTDIAIVQDGIDFSMLASFTSLGPAQEGGVLRSDNGGFTWSPSGSGLPVGAQCAALAASPTDTNLFYVADADFGAGGVHMTDDAGETWSSLGFGDRVTGIVADAADNATLFIMQPTVTRVQVTHDGGETFAPFNTGLNTAGFVRSITHAAGTCDRLLISTSTGTYVSDLATAATADADSDGDVDLDDFDLFNECLGGDTASPCCAFDFDANGAIDWADFGGFQLRFAAP